MSFRRCPGSMAFSQPKIEIAACPDCGAEVEIWSDEASGTCSACRKEVVRAARQSCVDWCRYAEQCLGEEKYKKYAQMKSAIRKEAILKAAADIAGDAERGRRARAAVAAAESALKKQPEADPNVVIAVVALRAAGIAPAAEGAAGAEDGGAADARKVLTGLGYPNGFITEVCDILGRLAVTAPAADDSVNCLVAREACR